MISVIHLLMKNMVGTTDIISVLVLSVLEKLGNRVIQDKSCNRCDLVLESSVRGDTKRWQQSSFQRVVHLMK